MPPVPVVKVHGRPPQQPVAQTTSDLATSDKYRNGEDTDIFEWNGGILTTPRSQSVLNAEDAFLRPATALQRMKNGFGRAFSFRRQNRETSQVSRRQTSRKFRRVISCITPASGTVQRDCNQLKCRAVHYEVDEEDEFEDLLSGIEPYSYGVQDCETEDGIKSADVESQHISNTKSESLRRIHQSPKRDMKEVSDNGRTDPEGCPENAVPHPSRTELESRVGEAATLLATEPPRCQGKALYAKENTTRNERAYKVTPGMSLNSACAVPFTHGIGNLAMPSTGTDLSDCKVPCIQNLSNLLIQSPGLKSDGPSGQRSTHSVVLEPGDSISGVVDVNGDLKISVVKKIEVVDK